MDEQDRPRAIGLDEKIDLIAEVVQTYHVGRLSSFLTNILDAIADPIFVKDAHHHYSLVNVAFCEFVGFSREALLGHTDSDFFPPEQCEVFYAKDREVFQSRETNINEEVLQGADGDTRIIRTTKTVFEDDNGQTSLVGIITDLTTLRRAQRELEKANRRLRDLAHQDRLTGLHNRMAFEGILHASLSQAEQLKENLAVLFLDLNGFKQVNDTLGHPVGDSLIVAVAERIKGVLLGRDTVARVGGDEFVVLVHQCDDTDAAFVAQRIADSVAEPYEFGGRPVSVTTSIGIALFPKDGRTKEALIKHADGAMYRAKRETKQPFEFHCEALKLQAERTSSLPQALQRALSEGSVTPSLHPLIDPRSGSVLGFESMAHWTHPEEGEISRDELLLLAESQGLMASISMSILDQAARFIAKNGLAGQFVTVQFSCPQLQDPTFPEGVATVIRQAGARPEQVVLEVTESTIASPQPEATLTHLHALGLRIWVKDFDFGYPSLRRLKNLPISAVRLDRDLVQALEGGEVDAVITQAFSAVAEGMGIDLIADGVETSDQARRLTHMGVRACQGDLYGKPMSPAQARDFLQTSRQKVA